MSGLSTAFVVAAGLLARGQVALDAVRPQAISAHVRFLADDLLEGRDTGSRGEAIAQRYVATEMQAIGLVQSLQPVHLVRVRARGSLSDLKPVIVLGDGTGGAKQLEGPLVFAGHGLAEDVARLDLRGAIVAVLSGAPATLSPIERALASYNEDKLARLRAKGAIAEVVLTTPEVDQIRPWPALERNFANGQVSNADALPRLPVAYVDLPTSQRLQREKPARLELQLTQTTEKVESANVIGVLPGRSSEAIIYTAHLDHHGICAPRQPDPICNGAIDDATGIAEMLEIARGFAALPDRARTVLFIATTGEERGLRGAQWFATHPTIPPSSIVANLNLDVLLPAWPVHELVLRGAELSTLEDHVRAAAAELGLVIGPDPVPEQTFFARTDAIWFARAGIPSATLWQGFTDPSGSKARGEAAFKDFRKNRYHQPGDEWSSEYDWNAAAQMARAELLIGISLLDGPPPQWKPDAPFRRR
jgi:hypothetical protein